MSRRIQSLFLVCVSILILAPSLSARSLLQGDVQRGGQTLSVTTGATTRQYATQSYPGATVTIYLTGTTTKPTLYTTSLGSTTKANPFSADNVAHWTAYIDDGVYDVRFSGGGLSAPFTLSAIGVGSAAIAGNVFNVLNYGARGDDIIDDSAAFAACLTAAKAVGRAIFKMPASSIGYYLSSGLVFDGNDLVAVVGDGENQTKLVYAIVAGGPLMTISPHTGQITANGALFRDFRIDGTGSGSAKTAIKLDGVSSSTLQNLTLNVTGNTGDVALQINGIDQTVFSNLYLQASTPIRMGKASTLSVGAAGAIDHMHFTDLSLIGSDDTKPLISVDVGTSIANTTFDGRQTWVGGFSGFDYNNTSATLGEIVNTKFENIRWENSGTQIASGPPVPVHGYMFRIVPNTASAQSGEITFINCYGGADGQQGFYLRRLQYVTWIGTQFNGPANLARVNLDADNTNNRLLMLGTNFGVGANATVTLGNQLLDYLALDQINTSGPVSSSIYGLRYLAKTQTDPSFYTDKSMGVFTWRRTFTIAPGATVDLPRPTTSGPSIIRIVSEDSARSVTTVEYGSFACNFSAGPTLIVGSNSTNVAAGNVGSKLCVDYTGATNQAQIHNNLAYTVTVTVTWN